MVSFPVSARRKYCSMRTEQLVENVDIFESHNSTVWFRILRQRSEHIKEGTHVMLVGILKNEWCPPIASRERNPQIESVGLLVPSTSRRPKDLTYCGLFKREPCDKKIPKQRIAKDSSACSTQKANTNLEKIPSRKYLLMHTMSMDSGKPHWPGNKNPHQLRWCPKEAATAKILK